MKQQIEKKESFPCGGSRFQSGRKRYKTPEIEIIALNNDDVITSSLVEKDNAVDDKSDWNIDNWGLNW